MDFSYFTLRLEEHKHKTSNIHFPLYLLHKCHILLHCISYRQYKTGALAVHVPPLPLLSECKLPGTNREVGRREETDPTTRSH